MPTGAVGIEEEFNETIFESASTDGGLKFWPWVNQVRSCFLARRSSQYVTPQQTPMTVSPQLPLEIVMQLFKRMGWVFEPFRRIDALTHSNTLGLGSFS